MLTALGHVLPIAVAVALSSVPIMATILILLSSNKNRSSIPFLIGWVVGIAAMVVIFTALAQVVPLGPPRKSQAAIGTALVVIGLVLVGLAIVSWLRVRGRPAEGVPKWLTAVSSFGPWSSLGLGLVLNVRPKAVLLSAAAGLSLRGDRLTNGELTVVVVIYTIVSATTVAIPIVARLVAPHRTESWLLDARTWIEKNNRTVSILILIMIGVVVIGNGLTHY